MRVLVLSLLVASVRSFAPVTRLPRAAAHRSAPVMMGKAQDALNELNTAFFTVYDPITDALIDERGIFFDM